METKEKIKEVLVGLLRVKPEELKDALSLNDSIGVDSTEMVEAVIAMEKAFDVSLSPKEITKFSDPYLHFQKPSGIYVQGVKSPGNAQAAGFSMFDIVVSIGDRPIETLKDVREAHGAALTLEKGKRKLLFHIIRGGYRGLLVLDFEKDIEKMEEE